MGWFIGTPSMEFDSSRFGNCLLAIPLRSHCHSMDYGAKSCELLAMVANPTKLNFLRLEGHH